MASPLRIISSMATRQVLAELLAQFQQATGVPVEIESVGGVDAARRVEAGEGFDLVMLASGAIDKLIASGHVLPGSRVDLVNSGVAVAVRSGAPKPDISTEQAVRAAVLAAPRLSYSTGPSGVQLARLFERWGIADELKERIVQPPPGVPVGTLVARGEVALGFQQLSELLHLEGITVLGPLPPEIQIDTVFSAGVTPHRGQPEAVQRLLGFLNSPGAAVVKRRHGMEPVGG